MKVKNYLSLIKFSHSVFALPFAIIGLLLGYQEINNFEWQNSMLVMVCMLSARSAAMSFNRYIDWKIDAQNPRTKNREIPAGIIEPNGALWFCVLTSLLFLISTYFINRLCFCLAPVALLIVLGYSFTKRFTSLSHFVLGLGLSLAPLGAYIAITGHFATLPILFSLLVIAWVSGFDMLYALQDEIFDKENHLFSIPVAIGRKNTLLLSILVHTICIVMLLIAGWEGHFGLFYLLGASIFCILLVYQHFLLKVNDISKLNLAFFTTNGLASIIFAIFFIIDFLTK